MKLPGPIVRSLARLSPWLFPIAAIGAMWELVGGGWDINWHLLRIPEFFWTPPHLTLYSGASVVLAATGAAFLLRWTPPQPTRSVQVGSVVAFLGALLQVGAGGFDSWWHTAYGADDALSPPHVMLTTAILITAVGVVVALHAWRRMEPGRGLRAKITWVAHAIGVTAVAWAAWGWLFILTFPGFAAGSARIPNFGFALLTSGAFASLFPLMLLLSAEVVRVRGAATASALTQWIGFLTITVLMGGEPTGIEVGLGIALFVLPGLAVDVLYRPGTRYSAYVALAFGAILGQWGFVPNGIVSAMTQPSGAPAAFALAFLAGGIGGALLALSLSRKAHDLVAQDRTSISASA